MSISVLSYSFCIEFSLYLLFFEKFQINSFNNNFVSPKLVFISLSNLKSSLKNKLFFVKKIEASMINRRDLFHGDFLFGLISHLFHIRFLLCAKCSCLEKRAKDNLLGDGLLFVSVQSVAAWHPNAVRFTVLQQDHFFPDHKPGWYLYDFGLYVSSQTVMWLFWVVHIHANATNQWTMEWHNTEKQTNLVNKVIFVFYG